MGVEVACHLCGDIEVDIVEAGVAQENQLHALAGQNIEDSLVGLVIDKEADAVGAAGRHDTINISPWVTCSKEWLLLLTTLAHCTHPAARGAVSTESGTGRIVTFSLPRCCSKAGMRYLESYFW